MLKLQRRINKILCFHKILTQSILPGTNDCGRVTIFHDYERQYCSRAVIGFSDKGINRILDIEKKHKIKATFNIVGKLIEDCPSIIYRIMADGHEIGSHSYDHSIMTKLSKREIAEDLANTKTIFESIGLELNGFRSPQSRWTFKQMSIFLNEGLKWSAENDYSRFPYVITKSKNKYLVRMPIVIDDWAYESKKIRPSMMVHNINKCIDFISKKKVYGAIGFHPWVQGKNEERLSAFDDLMASLSERNDIEVVTFGQALSNYFGDS